MNGYEPCLKSAFFTSGKKYFAIKQRVKETHVTSSSARSHERSSRLVQPVLSTLTFLNSTLLSRVYKNTIGSVILCDSSIAASRKLLYLGGNLHSMELQLKAAFEIKIQVLQTGRRAGTRQ